jgi:hypothetical protein
MARQSYAKDDLKSLYKKEEKKDESLEFLLALDKKLHYIKKSTFTPNMRGSPFEIGIDQYNKDQSISTKEVKQLIQIVDDSLNYALIPFNTCMGFAVGFEVYNIDKSKPKRVLAFMEAQLPKGYDFNKMSQVFMTKHNLVKTKILDVEIFNDREHYTY